MVYNIIHLPQDYYIAFAISRQLAKKNVVCKLSPIIDDNTPDPFMNIVNGDKVIVTLNSDILFRKKLAKEVISAKKNGFNVFFLVTGGYNIHPDSPWNKAIENCMEINILTGLVPNTIKNIIGLPSEQEYMIAACIDPTEADESESKEPHITQYEHNNNSESSVSSTSLEKESNKKLKGSSTDNIPEVAISNQVKVLESKADTTKNLDICNLNNNISIKKSYKDEIDVTIKRKKEFKLKTCMTKMPNTQKAKDVKEAYRVPTYILVYDRCDRIIHPQSAFECAFNHEITITRALKYLFGDGVPQNIDRSFTLFEKALSENMDDPIAIYCVATCLEYAVGTNKNISKAKEYYEKASNLGCE